MLKGRQTRSANLDAIDRIANLDDDTQVFVAENTSSLHVGSAVMHVEISADPSPR